MKRKLVKNNSYQVLTKAKFINVPCRKCGKMVQCHDNVISAVCSSCTSKMAPLSDTDIKRLIGHVKEVSDKPRGWKFMAEFVDKDGNVFHRGVEQPKLKGKLPVTDVAKLKAEQKVASAKKKKMKQERKEKKLLRDAAERAKVKAKEKKQKEKKLKELMGE